MNEAETAEFWLRYNQMRSSDQRVGQAMMNALRVVAPELYAEAVKLALIQVGL